MTPSPGVVVCPSLSVLHHQLIEFLYIEEGHCCGRVGWHKMGLAYMLYTWKAVAGGRYTPVCITHGIPSRHAAGLGGIAPKSQPPSYLKRLSCSGPTEKTW